MSVQIREAIDSEVIRAASRVLVYLTVDWSVPERASRQAFLEAARRLSANQADLGIAFYSLDEEAPVVRDFLIPFGCSGKYAQGSGGLIWLESGRMAAVAVAGHLLGADGIVERTLDLWGGRPPALDDRAACASRPNS